MNCNFLPPSTQSLDFNSIEAPGLCFAPTSIESEDVNILGDVGTLGCPGRQGVNGAHGANGAPGADGTPGGDGIVCNKCFLVSPGIYSDPETGVSLHFDSSPAGLYDCNCPSILEGKTLKCNVYSAYYYVNGYVAGPGDGFVNYSTTTTTLTPITGTIHSCSVNSSIFNALFDRLTVTPCSPDVAVFDDDSGSIAYGTHRVSASGCGGPCTGLPCSYWSESDVVFITSECCLA